MGDSLTLRMTSLAHIGIELAKSVTDSVGVGKFGQGSWRSDLVVETDDHFCRNDEFSHNFHESSLVWSKIMVAEAVVWLEQE